MTQVITGEAERHRHLSPAATSKPEVGTGVSLTSQAVRTIACRRSWRTSAPTSSSPAQAPCRRDEEITCTTGVADRRPVGVCVGHRLTRTSGEHHTTTGFRLSLGQVRCRCTLPKSRMG
jgi:hypothetical protein